MTNSLDLTPEQLSSARGQTHGSFADNAKVAMDMRTTIRSVPGWDTLSQTRQLALDEIVLKVARAVSGGSEEGILEAFTDIAGYGNLGKKG